MDNIIKPEEREEVEEKLKESYRMDGVLVDDDEVIREVAGEFDSKSKVVKLGRKKDGELDKNSERYLISEEELGGLQEEVKAITTELCEEILDGRIELRPKKVGKSDPCAYCGYRSICNFDPSFSGCGYEYI